MVDFVLKNGNPVNFISDQELKFFLNNQYSIISKLFLKIYLNKD